MFANVHSHFKHTPWLPGLAVVLLDVYVCMYVLLTAGHTGAVYALAVLNTPGRERLFSACYDKTIRVRHLQSHSIIETGT